MVHTDGDRPILAAWRQDFDRLVATRDTALRSLQKYP
jgi:hypothetical protein